MAKEYHSESLHIIRNIVIPVNIIINVLGIIGALIIITVMRQSEFRSKPRSLIYISLSVIDLLFCVFLLADKICFLVYGEALAIIGVIACQIDRFFTHFLVHMDAWLLIILTVERVVAIVKPLEVSTIVTRSKVKVTVIAMAIFFLTLDGELSASSGLANGPTHLQIQNKTMPLICTRVNHYNISPKIFSFMDIGGLLLGSFIPFLIIFILNVVLSAKLIKRKQARANLGATGSGIQNEAGKITRMVMVASFGFILMTAPIVIYLILGNHDKNDPIHMILRLIFQMNPAANFYIYFLSGSLFRQEVKRLFCI